MILALNQNQFNGICSLSSWFSWVFHLIGWWIISDDIQDRYRLAESSARRYFLRDFPEFLPSCLRLLFVCAVPDWQTMDSTTYISSPPGFISCKKKMQEIFQSYALPVFNFCLSPVSCNVVRPSIVLIQPTIIGDGDVIWYWGLQPSVGWDARWRIGHL